MPIPAKHPEEQPKTAKERVYQKVREWIVNGTLEPGEKISDQDLAEYFSVSRTPVREAIQMLADQKLISIQAGKETRVAPLDLEEAVLNYHIMADLQALALEFAYPHLMNTHIAELQRIDQHFATAKASRRIEEAETYDRQFHGVFIRLSGSYFISEFTNILNSHIQRTERIFYQKNTTQLFSPHAPILKALEEHKLEEAKAAMQNNWLNTLRSIQEQIG